MTDILVTSPFRPFTLPTQFKAVFNGYIYCGTVDAVDPSVSQVQVYLVNESGDRVPVAQPLRTNAGGFLVYNGQPAKFVTSSNHSLLVRDSLGSQLWYAPDVSIVDPDAAYQTIGSQAFEALRRSYAEVGYNVVGTLQAGFTYVNANDVGIDLATGKGYTGPAGPVAPGTDPMSGGFVDRSYATLSTPRILPISAHGAIEDGVSDETQALIRAFASGYVNLKDGVTYNATSIPDVNNDVVVTGKGTIKCNSKIRIKGAVSQLSTLGANALAGSYSITSSSALAVSPGDQLIIHNTALGSFSRHRDFYTLGEYVFVKSVSGTTVELQDPLLNNYTASSAVKILKPQQVNVDIKDASFVGGDTGSTLEIMLARNVRVDCKTKNEIGAASLSIDRCYDVKLAGEHRCTAPADQQQYGAVVRSSWNVLSEGGIYHGTRHGFATGGTTGDGYIQSRNVIVIGGETSSVVSHSSDFHGNIEESAFVGVNHRNGVCLAGKNTRCVGGSAVCNLTATPVLGTREIVGGRIRFAGMSAEQKTTRSPFGQFSTSEAVKIDTPFNVEYDDIDLKLHSTPDQYISRFSFATDTAIKFGVSFTRIKINGASSTISGFLTFGAPDLGRLSSLTIDDISTVGVSMVGDGWTRNAGLYSINGETVWTLPEYTGSATVTIPNGSQVSPEGVVTLPTPSREQKWQVSLSIDGLSSGSSPFLTPIVGRAHLSGEARVRIFSLSGNVSADTTEIVSARFGIDKRPYNQNLIPS